MRLFRSVLFVTVLLAARSVLFVTVLLAASAAFAQKQFEGYSLDVDANIGGSCPIAYLPSAGAGAVQVFVAGSDQKTPAASIKACDGAQFQGNRLSANGLG